MIVVIGGNGDAAKGGGVMALQVAPTAGAAVGVASAGGAADACKAM